MRVNEVVQGPLIAYLGESTEPSLDDSPNIPVTRRLRDDSPYCIRDLSIAGSKGTRPSAPLKLTRKASATAANISP